MVSNRRHIVFHLPLNDIFADGSPISIQHAMGDENIIHPRQLPPCAPPLTSTCLVASIRYHVLSFSLNELSQIEYTPDVQKSTACEELKDLMGKVLNPEQRKWYFDLQRRNHADFKAWKELVLKTKRYLMEGSTVEIIPYLSDGKTATKHPALRHRAARPLFKAEAKNVVMNGNGKRIPDVPFEDGNDQKRQPPYRAFINGPLKIASSTQEVSFYRTKAQTIQPFHHARIQVFTEQEPLNLFTFSENPKPLRTFDSTEYASTSTLFRSTWCSDPTTLAPREAVDSQMIYRFRVGLHPLAVDSDPAQFRQRRIVDEQVRRERSERQFREALAPAPQTSPSAEEVYRLVEEKFVRKVLGGEPFQAAFNELVDYLGVGEEAGAPDGELWTLMLELCKERMRRWGSKHEGCNMRCTSISADVQ